MRKMIKLMLLCNVVMASTVFAMSQEQLDELIENDVLMLEHHEDSEDAINNLLLKGTTRSAIAESFARIAKRYMHEPISGDHGFVCKGAIYNLGVYADNNQLTNLVDLAMQATNINAHAALSAYCRHKKGNVEFVGLAERFLERKDIGIDNKSVAWDLLKEKIDQDRLPISVVRNRILQIANVHVKTIDENTPYADGILVLHEIGYAISAKRRSVVQSILNSKNHFLRSDFLRRKYSEIKDKIQMEEK